MANVTAYVALNMLGSNLTWTATGTTVSSSYIRLESYPHRQDLFGSFTYSNGLPTGGIINTSSSYEYGALTWSVTNLSLDLPTYNSYLTSNNPQGLFAYVLGGADTFTGSPYGDVLETFAGNDSITGGAGNDILIGGSGTDTAVFLGIRAQSVLLPQPAGWLVVVGPNGVDVVKEIEVLQFYDRTVNVASLTLPTVSGGVYVAAASPIDMSNPKTWSGTYTFRDPSALRLENSTNTGMTFGSFGFDSSGNPISGTIQSYVTAESGVARLWITGLNLSLNTYKSYIAVNDHQGLYGLALAGNDSIHGSSGNDVLIGYAGNDTIDGGTGSDTAVFHGTRAQYSINPTANGIAVSGVDGVDTLTNVEFARFSDQTVVLDNTPPVAPILVATYNFNFLVNPQVTLQTSLGSVVLELNPERAPITVANLLAYVNDGFYDGTLFHRVIPNFMVQGGGFTSGLVAKTPTYEPIVLESYNSLSNLRGTIAMARTSEADSATSQFFINQKDNGALDYASTSSPGYAAFGKVLTGLSVIDSIAQVPTATVGSYQNVPTTNVAITSFRQTLAGSAITNAATLYVRDVEIGAQWWYSLDGGDSWIAGSGESFAVPVGNYAANTIQIRQTDAVGNPGVGTGKLSSALVVETTAPTIIEFSPTDDASGVAVGSNIVLNFSETIARGVGTILLKNASGVAIEGFDAASSSRLSLNGSTLTIDPSADLAAGNGYRLELATGAIRDLAGNNHAGTTSYNFATNANPTGIVGVGGTATQGQTLTATNFLADADGLGTPSYQWLADGHVIGGATAGSLVLREAQVGKTISVIATYTDGHGTLESVASSATGAVANINDTPCGSIRVGGTPTPGQTLTAAAHLFDADGLGTIGLQWQSSSDGSTWNPVAGATANTLTLTAEQIGQQLRAVGSYSDGHDAAESVASAPITVYDNFPGRSADLLAYSWKSHVALNEVMVGAAGGSHATTSAGATSIAGIIDTNLALTASRTIPAAETTATAQAVNLQDAIAVLKLVVGLDVNGAGRPLSPYQAYAADFDGDGAVNLNDAIKLLKHVVGLDAPHPAWTFFNEATAPAPANPMQPGSVPPLAADLSAASTSIHVGLVGVLRGDVDGSFAGAPTATAIDLAQPMYFQNLAATHDLNASQFGIYSA